MRLHGKMTLRARLVLLIALAAIPAITLILYNGVDSRSKAAAAARHDVMRLVRLNAEDQVRILDEGRRLLVLLSKLPQVDPRHPSECNAVLSHLLEKNSSYSNFGVIRLNGDLACSAVPISHPVNFADRSYFRSALLNRQFAVSEYLTGRITGLPSLVLAHPLFDQRGEVEGVVYAALPINWINENMRHVDLPAGSVLTVLDAKGTVLARYPDPEQWTGVSAKSTAVWKAIQSGDVTSTVEAEGLDGAHRLFGFTPLLDLPGVAPAYVTIGIPTDLVYADAKHYLLRSLIAVLVLTLATALIAWKGSQVFVIRELSNLANLSRRIAHGDLAVRVPVKEMGQEIADLGHAFNEMADELAQRDEATAQHLNRIRRLNRIHAVLSGINSAIIRIRERQELLREVCRIAVDAGKFRLAWVGLISLDGKVLKPYAIEGASKDLFRDLHIPISGDVAEGRGPTGVALREGRHMVSNNIGKDPRMQPWYGIMRSGGLDSVAAFPLKIDDQTVGTLTLYTGEPDFFDDEEIKLLLELAADTSLGLSFIEKEEKLHFAAYYDSLTGLPNRNLLHDRLAQAIAESDRHKKLVAILSLDLDRFKEVNDSLGHQAGDELLRSVAKRLHESVREEDTVARLGGDEYIVVVQELGRAEDAGIVAQNILNGFGKPFQIHAQELFVSVSIGISVYPADGADMGNLLKYADTAMYHAKSEGRGNFQFYAPAMTARSQERLTVENGLRKALERDEFFLEYQPQVDIITGRIVGIEALIRWQSPEKGKVPPTDFISVAEDTGLIVPIGKWVLEVACEQLVALSKEVAAGANVKVGVNVSSRQLRQSDFVDNVRAIIERTGIRPAQLELEITESVLMDDNGDVYKTLNLLNAMGLTFSIDDFGTGYSSLSYLKRFPIDKLKIDQSFVRDSTTDANDAALIRAIIAMAHSLKLKVIAEGVETDEQAAFLRREGCDEIQGFLVGRPAAPEAIREMLRKTG